MFGSCVKLCNLRIAKLIHILKSISLGDHSPTKTMPDIYFFGPNNVCNLDIVGPFVEHYFGLFLF